MKKIAFLIILCLASVFFAAGCSVMAGSTDLQNETIAGVRLYQAVDISALEKELGPLTDNQAIEKGGRAITFDNPTKYAYILTDEDNRVVQITVGYPSRTGNTKIETGRGIGSLSSFTDVAKAYGSAYSRYTYHDFMGSGDGYFIKYTDWDRHVRMEFGFVEDETDGGFFLSNIMMKIF